MVLISRRLYCLLCYLCCPLPCLIHHRATTQKNAQATLPKALVEMANEYLADYSKRTAARKAHNHTSSATDSRSSNSSGKSVNSTQALLEELDIFLEHGKEMIAARLPKSV